MYCDHADCRHTLSPIMIPNFRSNDTQPTFSMVTCCVKRMCLDGKLYLQTLSGFDLPFWKIHIRHFLCITLPNIDYRSVSFYKIQNKYSQKRNCAATVQIFTMLCLWLIYIFPRSMCLAYSAAGKYGYRSWAYINRAQTHECGHWDWGRRNSLSGNT